ncbi:VRR-NUC domain containing protein [uncultured Caudovirales phage]|uniref:VRR-NUC domain containing protein n=1 Tax=uncultured Caudovirales phage TaxID=2100421 RepID=A0A6J5RNY5_9CAUD|nr:VRR-NUC domain containing protein [uncultured Caudovirales phage]
MGKPEGRIEKALVARIKAIGGEIRKSVWVGKRGCPDRFVMLPTRHRVHVVTVAEGLGRWVRNPWVECKAPGEPLEDHQEREHKKMRDRGELVLVIDTLALIDRYFPLVVP